MPTLHSYSPSLTRLSVPTGDRASLSGLADATVHSQSYIQRLTFPIPECGTATVNPPSTDRNIRPRGRSQLICALRYTIWIYSAVDHCTGRRWISQTKAPSAEAASVQLVQIYGRGLELLSVEPL